MTLEAANQCLDIAKHYGDWTPLEEALFTLITDLQVRHVESLDRIARLEKDLNE